MANFSLDDFDPVRKVKLWIENGQLRARNSFNKEFYNKNARRPCATCAVPPMHYEIACPNYDLNLKFYDALVTNNITCDFDFISCQETFETVYGQNSYSFSEIRTLRNLAQTKLENMIEIERSKSPSQQRYVSYEINGNSNTPAYETNCVPQQHQLSPKYNTEGDDSEQLNRNEPFITTPLCNMPFELKRKFLAESNIFQNSENENRDVDERCFPQSKKMCFEKQQKDCEYPRTEMTKLSDTVKKFMCENNLPFKEKQFENVRCYSERQDVKSDSERPFNGMKRHQYKRKWFENGKKRRRRGAATEEFQVRSFKQKLISTFENVSPVKRKSPEIKCSEEFQVRSAKTDEFIYMSENVTPVKRKSQERENNQRRRSAEMEELHVRTLKQELICAAENISPVKRKSPEIRCSEEFQMRQSKIEEFQVRSSKTDEFICELENVSPLKRISPEIVCNRQRHCSKSELKPSEPEPKIAEWADSISLSDLSDTDDVKYSDAVKEIDELKCRISSLEETLTKLKTDQCKDITERVVQTLNDVKDEFMNEVVKSVVAQLQDKLPELIDDIFQCSADVGRFEPCEDDTLSLNSDIVDSY